MNITEYTVVDSISPSQLDQKVNAKIAQGWQPIGGVSCNILAGIGYLAQAMVKYASVEIHL